MVNIINCSNLAIEINHNNPNPKYVNLKAFKSNKCNLCLITIKPNKEIVNFQSCRQNGPGGISGLGSQL